MTLKDAALGYYDRGWMPIPLRSHGSPEDRKKPAVDRWRQYQFIRPDRQQIADWWTDQPDANIALITGRVSGLVVIDFDGEPPGNIPDFVRSHDLPEGAALVKTGKGFHLYLKHPGGDVPNGVRVGRLGGIPLDIRGDGGYVVAPPSVHGSGTTYHWISEGASALPVLPDALRAAIQQSPDVERVLAPDDLVRESTELDRILKGVGEGERNHVAARVCGYLLKVTKQDEPAAWAILKIWNASNKPPLSGDELRDVFNNIARAARESALDELLEADRDEHLLHAAEWADAVRDVPPRKGYPVPSLPGLEEVGGVVEKDLVILAGRPGLGKSTAAWGAVYDVALRQKVPTLVFSTEMTAVDVARWMACRIFKKPFHLLTREEWGVTLDLISHSPVTLCDRGAVSPDYITRVLDMHPQTKLVIIDHVQRVQLRQTENRNRDLESFATNMKNEAKDRGMTVLLLSQLNRLNGISGRPGLQALRDSGGLEQEADAVIFIWSDAPDPTANPLDVKFYVAKNRHGPLAEISCRFLKDEHRFEAEDLRGRINQLTAERDATHKLNQIMEGIDDAGKERLSGVPAVPVEGEGRPDVQLTGDERDLLSDVDGWFN